MPGVSFLWRSGAINVCFKAATQVEAPIRQRPGTRGLSVPQTAPGPATLVPPGPRARPLLPPGHRISSLRFQRCSAASRVGPRALLPPSLKLPPFLRCFDYGAPRRATPFFYVDSSRSRQSRFPLGALGGYLSFHRSSGPGSSRTATLVREDALLSGASDASSLQRGPEFATASSPALIRCPRVSDLDPLGSERTPTTSESWLKTRGGQLWWQDSGG
ncbi:hypothetical protein NDU88_006815 [Pleurodeles waltl]|uniref:Uncharacterized protein n=1 Tax=Pleurodeles waltl TaxID=8319 RepID=A0AAV7VQQ8_PLEWA|nr:hypothetical protein NDU88_006815 [Pleurodeles waltl]